MSLILSGTTGVSDVDGTAATPALRGTDTNTGIFFPAADTIAFAEGGVEAARIDSSGNLGLGVTPSAWWSIYRAAQFPAGVSVAGRNDGGIEGIFATNAFRNSAGTWTYVNNGVARRYVQEADGHLWLTAPSGTAGNAISFTQAMTLDASGNLGIGTSSPATRLHAQTTGADIEVRATTISSGNVRFGFDASGAFYNWIQTDRASGALQFAQGNTERARIDSSGRFIVNGGTGFGAVAITASATNIGTITNAALWINVTSSSYKYAQFEVSGSPTGSITTNGSTTSYNTSSDYRLKENIQPMIGALAKVAALKPCTYTWKATGEADEGFIAHELQEVCPSAVTGEKDEVNEDGSIKPQGIDTSFLVATLTAAIQEQQAIIEQLTTRIAALEAK